MFDLKYKITDGDIKAVNKKTMLFYFVLYLAVAVVGITVGIIAVVLAPSRLMYVLGIILLVLGGILGICALMLLIAPKNFISSAVKPSNDEIEVHIDESGIAVATPSEDVKIPFASVTEVRDKKEYLLVFVGKDVALLIKNAFITGGGLAELFKFLSARRGGLTNPVTHVTENASEQSGNNDGTENTADGGEDSGAETPSTESENSASAGEAKAPSSDE